MQVDSRLVWEKLNLELECVSRGEAFSLAPTLLGVGNILKPNSDPTASARNLNFLTFQATAECGEGDRGARFRALNTFFFERRGFAVSNDSLRRCSAEHLLLDSILESRIGHHLPLTILYIHLAQQIGLPVSLLSCQSFPVLKWVTEQGKAQFMNFSEKAKPLDSGELLKIVNKLSQIDLQAFDKLEPKAILSRYLHSLLEFFAKTIQCGERHDLLSMLIRVDPSNLDYLAQRALLRREMGMPREAITDLKRYFAFSHQDKAPTNLQVALRELEGLVKTLENPIRFLH